MDDKHDRAEYKHVTAQQHGIRARSELQCSNKRFRDWSCGMRQQCSESCGPCTVGCRVLGHEIRA